MLVGVNIGFRLSWTAVTCQARYMMDKVKIEKCVESLCQNGCTAVYATISALEKDLHSVPLNGLAVSERQHVLEELKAIMAVYENPCDSD